MNRAEILQEKIPKLQSGRPCHSIIGKIISGNYIMWAIKLIPTAPECGSAIMKEGSIVQFPKQKVMAVLTGSMKIKAC